MSCRLNVGCGGLIDGCIVGVGGGGPLGNILQLEPRAHTANVATV